MRTDLTNSFYFLLKNVCAIAYQSATMLVLCSNVTVSVKKFTCVIVSVRLDWSLDQLGRHISTVIIIIITPSGRVVWSLLTAGGGKTVNKTRTKQRPRSRVSPKFFQWISPWSKQMTQCHDETTNRYLLETRGRMWQPQHCYFGVQSEDGNHSRLLVAESPIQSVNKRTQQTLRRT